MSVQDSSDKTTSPPTIPLFIHENTILKGSSRLDGIDSTIWAQASVASILFFIYTTSPQESYESQLERRWDLKVVLLRTQLRLNAPRHFGWSHFVGHWLSPVLAHYPLLLTVLCKFCLSPTDDIGEREREERIVDYTEVEVELIVTLKFRWRFVDPPCFFFLGVNNSISLQRMIQGWLYLFGYGKQNTL